MIRWSFNNIRFVLVAFALWLTASHVLSQNVFSSEDDMKKQANKLFDDEEYVQAYPLFSQLLSLYPKDPQYNFKFGTCLLYAGNDKGKAIPYIEYAAKRQKQGVDKEVFFFLAKAYHLNYRFADAIRLYTTYKGMVSSRVANKFEVDRQIEMCQNGLHLLKNITELSVLEKKEVPESDFFRSYNLNEFNAKIIVKPDDLKTSLDKKKKDNGIMYLDPNSNKLYYSSYGNDDKNGKDIYYVTRTSTGDLSKPVRLSDVINTKYDEDYPFLRPDGKILYFCSKGHNSMGGYDIFQSNWDDKTNSWSEPVNMDFAINTPDDDILFISDSANQTAYFSSKRESAQGNITVYKIKLKRKPLNVSVINGVLAKEMGDKVPTAKITVTKFLKNEVVGVFNSNAADGSYTLDLPNGGKFLFTVESAGFKKSSELIVIPTQQEIKPLKQQMSLVHENGKDSLLIKNEFETQPDSVDLALAAQYLKAKASLEVTPIDTEVTASAVEDKNAPSVKEENKDNSSAQEGKQKSITPVSNSDIIAIAYQDAQQTQQDANEMSKGSDAAQQLANKKNDLSVQKNMEAQALIKSADTIKNQDAKMAQIDKATKLKNDADELSQEAALTLTISNEMNDQAKAKQQQASEELKYAKDMDNAITSGASEKKMNELLAKKERLDRKNDSLNLSFPPDMNKMAQVKQTDASKVMAKYLDVQQDVEDMQKESQRLRSEAEKAQNDGVKQNLNQQAEDMENELAVKKKNADSYNAQAAHLQLQADSIKRSAVLASSMLKEIKSSTQQQTVLSKTEQPKETAITVSEKPETKYLAAGNTQSITPAANNVTSQPTNPNTVQPTYADVFAKQIQDAGKKGNDIDKEEAKAVIYQAWTDSLDKQVAVLKKKYESNTNDSLKTQMQHQILDLQSSADDNRQKAADSRNNVDNLKLKAALAAASAISTDTTTAKTTTTSTSTDTATSAQKLTRVKNINDYYEANLKKSDTIKNEYEKKSKEQELYEDWSSSLYDESQRLKKDGNNGKAEDVDKESKSKQLLAMKSAEEVTQIKAERPELVTASVKKNEKQTKTPDATTTAATSSEIKSNIQPINTSTTTLSPSATTVTANTDTAKHPVEFSDTKTVTTTPSETASSTIKPETTNPITEPSSVITPAAIQHKDEYAHYNSLKSESDWNRKHADWQYKQADDLRKISEQQFSESQKLSQQIKTSNDPNVQNELRQKSEDLDKHALRNQAKADSIKMIAQNSEAEANSKKTESELYLQSLDKATYEEIATSTGYKPTTVETNTITSSDSTIANHPPIKPAETKTVTASQPVTTEAVNTNTLTPENPSTVETAQTKTVTPENPVATQTDIEKKSDVGKQKPVSTGRTETVAINNQPKNSSAVSIMPTKPDDDLLKYYDKLFDKLDLSGSSYSNAKPIPVDPPMPDGLVFKVQIGAFKNAIPQNLFKGIKPITSETTPQGFKRYSAGLFKTFSTANDAKNQVKDLGYRDAFVVAFFNGKRISMNDALTKAKEAGENIDVASLNENNNNANVNAATQQVNNSAIQIANTTDVKSVGGLFYSIQIGVFSKPVSAVQLYNISPLNSENTNNGLIRYTTGRFDDEVKANKAKNTISEKGISDAFVIAYYNGKRISLSEAKKMIDAQGKEILSKQKQEYTFVPSDTTTSETSSKALTTSANKGIVFRVQVGAFKEQVPVDIANKLIENSDKGIKTFKDENGLMVYTIGEFLEYESANNLKSQLISKGLNGAFIIGFKDGKKIPASDALKMIKNQ